MATDYESIPPIGQFDSMASWAACLAWWLQAAGDGRPAWSQAEVIAQFDKHCSGDGGFDAMALIEVWKKDARLRLSAEVFMAEAGLHELPAGEAPMMIAYDHPEAGPHMNVIFGRINGSVTAMEPYFPYPGQDGKRSGTFAARSLDFFTGRSPRLILCWPT